MNLVLALLLAIVASFFGVAQAGQLQAAPQAITAPATAPVAPATAAAPAMNPVASGARLAPTLFVCPSAADAITMSSPPVCEPSDVYAYAAPAGWVYSDPVPAWVIAP